MNRKINQKGVELIKQFESCRLEAYQDVGGIWTCGWGSTGPDVVKGVVWTQEQADNRLYADLERIEAGLEGIITCQYVDDNEYAALVAFAYNVGVHALATSHLLGLVNMGKFYAASEEFVKWDHVKGVEVPGLLRRREAERDLFLLDEGFGTAA